MFLKTPDKQLLLNSQIQQKVDDEGRMKLKYRWAGRVGVMTLWAVVKWYLWEHKFYKPEIMVR